MRLKRLILDGVANLHNVDINFDLIGRGVIAVCGDTGSGKTHILECAMPGILYRTLPSYRCKIGEHITSSNALIEVWYDVHGIEVGLRIFGGKQLKYSIYTEGDWKSGIGAREYDAFVASIFPPASLLLASRYASQGDDRGFFLMSKGDRADILSRLFDLDIYDTWVEAGKNKRKEAISALSPLSIRRKELRHNADILSQLKQRKHCARILIENLEVQKQQTQASIKTVSDRIAAYESKLCDVESERSRLKCKIRDFDSDVHDVSKEIDEINNAVCADVRKKAARDLIVSNSEISLCTKDVDKYDKMLKENNDLLEDANVSVTRLSATARIEKDSTQKRIAELELMIKDVSDQISSVDVSLLCDVCPLLTNNQGFVAREKKLKDELVQIINDDHTTLTETNKKIREYTADISTYSESIAAVSADRASALDRLSSAIKLRDESESIVSGKDATRDDAMLCVLNERRDVLLHKIEQCNEEISRLRDPDRPERDFDSLSQSQNLLSEIATSLSTAEKDMHYICGQMHAMRDTQNELSIVEHEYRSVNETSHDSGIIIEACRAAKGEEVLNIAPALEQTANDMLSCYKNGMLSININPYTINKDGSKRNGFVPIIHNASLGSVVGGVSGGQYALMGEAIRLAVCLIMSQRSGYNGGTLIRDESAEKFDEDLVSVYISMLKKWVDECKFDQILFACHHRHVWEMADKRIVVCDGGAEIV